MASAESIARALGRPDIWAGRALADTPAQATGFATLDRLLPGRGWPIGALTELVPVTAGIGELRLLLPTLRALTQQGRPILLIRPPHIPYPPALVRAGLPLNRMVWIAPDHDADARWAAEQALREGVAGAVLLWSETQSDLPLRRLQLAAQTGRALAFLYRPTASLRNPSASAVRLTLRSTPGAIRVDVLKARGGRGGASAICRLDRSLSA